MTEEKDNNVLNLCEKIIEDGKLTYDEVYDLSELVNQTINKCDGQLVKWPTNLLIKPLQEVWKDGERQSETIHCDDSGEGGTKIWRREVTETPNAFGVTCVPAEVSFPCGQRKCGKDCAVGDWTAWSECSTSCDQGVQSRSREITQKPKYGGEVRMRFLRHCSW